MTNRNRWIITAIVVIVAFLAGFLWQYTRAASLQTELETTQRELTYQRLEATLGAATIEAMSGSHEVARQLASDFFGGLQRATGDEQQRAAAARPTELDDLLDRRDAIITMLSRSDAASGEVLARVFLRYRVAVGGPQRALPVAAPGENGQQTQEPAREPAAPAETTGN